MIKFLYTDEFIKEFTKLKRAYHSLGLYDEFEGDFGDLKKALIQLPTGLGGVERINNLGNEIIFPVYKVRKFACKSLQSTTKLRIIYAYDATQEILHFIQFIEIYAKADKDNEDRERIRKILLGKNTLGNGD